MTRTATTTDAPAAPAVPDIADDLADLLRTGRMCGPTAVVRVAYTLADGRLVAVDLPAPRVTAGEDREDDGDRPETHADRVLQFLRGLRPGEWAKGRTIAAEIDLEYDGGQFKKLLAGLVGDDLLESSKANGYRLKRHNESL